MRPDGKTTVVPSEPNPQENIYYVTSPMVGIFYRASDPSSPPFVEIGDQIEKNQSLGIIEAMKLMNEIESEIEGTLEEIYVENGKPIEYGQRLFAIKPLS
ncbi:acetyl-CoA carboxylase biotin carboxyl carrier protein [Acidobacteriota bacterium]